MRGWVGRPPVAPALAGGGTGAALLSFRARSSRHKMPLLLDQFSQSFISRLAKLLARARGLRERRRGAGGVCLAQRRLWHAVARCMAALAA